MVFFQLFIDQILSTTWKIDSNKMTENLDHSNITLTFKSTKNILKTEVWSQKQLFNEWFEKFGDFEEMMYLIRRKISENSFEGKIICVRIFEKVWKQFRKGCYELLRKFVISSEN